MTEASAKDKITNIKDLMAKREAAKDNVVEAKQKFKLMREALKNTKLQLEFTEKNLKDTIQNA